MNVKLYAVVAGSTGLVQACSSCTYTMLALSHIGMLGFVPQNYGERTPIMGVSYEYALHDAVFTAHMTDNRSYVSTIGFRA